MKPSEEWAQDEARRTHAELRTRFAVSIASGMMAGGKVPNVMGGQGGFRPVHECDPTTVASHIFNLADVMAREDAVRRKRDQP